MGRPPGQSNGFNGCNLFQVRNKSHIGDLVIFNPDKMASEAFRVPETERRQQESFS